MADSHGAEAPRPVAPELLKAAVISTEIAKANTEFSADEKSMAGFLNEHHLTEDPKAALRVMVGEQPPEHVAIAILDNKIGAPDAKRDHVSGLKIRETVDKKDGKEGKDPTHETKLFNDGQKAIKDIYKAIETGVVEPKTSVAIIHTLMQDEGYHQVLSGMVEGLDAEIAAWTKEPNDLPAELKSFVDTLVTKAGFKRKLGHLLHEHLEIGKKKSEHESANKSSLSEVEIRQLREEQTELNFRLGRATEDEKAKVKDRPLVESLPEKLSEVREELKDFKPVDGKENKYFLMNKAQAAYLNAEQGKTAKEKEIETLRKKTLRDTDKKLNEEDIEKLERERNAFAKTYADNKAEYDQLKARKDELEKQETKVLGEITTTETRRKEIEKKLAQGVEGTKMVEDLQYVEGLKELFGEAAVEYLNDQLELAEDKYVHIVEARQKEERDELKTALDEKIALRWTQEDKVFFPVKIFRRAINTLGRNKKVLVPNKRQIEQDFNKYVSIDRDDEFAPEGGARGLVDSIMREEVEKIVREKYHNVEGDLTHEQSEEIKDKLDHLAKEKGDDVALKMLVERTRVGMKVTKEEAVRIQKLNPNIIQRAVEKDHELQRQMQELYGTGMIDPRTPMSPNLFQRELQGVLNLFGFGEPIKADEPKEPAFH